jgi:hypothetical protein
MQKHQIVWTEEPQQARKCFSPEKEIARDDAGPVFHAYSGTRE